MAQGESSRAASWVGFAVVSLASIVLLTLAYRHDLFCDDAFITLRYAKNLAEQGAPVYNLDERVEGYTSFLWMALAAFAFVLGLPMPQAMQALGGLSAIALLAASWRLWRRLHPGRVFAGALLLGALAIGAPLVGWTMGGLETPLFVALTTLSFVVAIDVARTRSLSRATLLGFVLGLATLTRPEGALVSAVIALVLGRRMVRDQRGRFLLGATLGGIAILLVPHEAWRWLYYGYPLPNSFYVKLSGDRVAAWAQGARYLTLAVYELGIGLFLALLVGLMGVRKEAASARQSAAALQSAAEGQAAAALLLEIGRLFAPLYLVYVLSIGGDFLDLYRFLAPLMPLAFVLFASALLQRFSVAPSKRWQLGLLLMLGLGYGGQQAALLGRADRIAEPSRTERGIEPMGWTRLYALRWAAIGRWIAAHSQPEDGMAVGAAGAMPYYAGLRNLDTFGLCDAWVAHHAPVLSPRPGHQRFAPLPYILSKDPVFLLIGNDYSSDTPQPLRRDPAWEARGYLWVQAHIDAERYGAPGSFYQYLLMRRDRAEQFAHSPWLRVQETGAARVGDDRASSSSGRRP